MSGYDNVAIYYDRLARLVFGRVLAHAQLTLINDIPAGAHLLIVGGGTGWILEEIAKVHPSDLVITYIDASAKMTALAAKRNAGKNQVTFIAAPVEQAATGSYDAVMTPFLFDNFKADSTQKIFSCIDGQLRPHGKWLYCDFRNTDVFWQKLLLKVMYLFFRVCCGIEASHLNDIDEYFKDYKVAAEQPFMNGFVTARVFVRR